MVVARFVSVGLACGSAFVLSACNAFDPAVLERLQSPIQTPVHDAGHDASEPSCEQQTPFENCNGVDDDCDGDVDEDADVACVVLNATAVCATGGRCVMVACKSGYVDCNERSADGCEHPEADGPCPMCDGEFCVDDAGMDAGPDPVEDAEVAEDAASEAAVEVDASEDACVEHDEICDGEDNDCDDEVDETHECEIEQCIATTPSYRGEACDRCVCEKCGAYTEDCQFNANATWAMQCRDVLECYVREDRAGNCGANEDCYGVGGGPCAAEINIAAGGSSSTDTSAAIGGGCNANEPPTTACMGAGNYRDHCTLDLCEEECGD